MLKNNIIIYTLIGCSAGFVSGLLGIGGAVLIVPGLVYICGFSQKMAQGTSLCVLLPPLGLFAAMEYYKEGKVNVTAAVIIIVFFLIASFFGSKLANRINSSVLQKLFAVLLLIIGLKSLF